MNRAGGIRWLAGRPALQARVEAALDDAREDPQTIHSSHRRTLQRLTLPATEAFGSEEDHPTAAESSACEIVLKVHHRGRGLRAARERLKGAARRSPARREWAALERAHGQGIPVPTPLALGRLGGGDELLVSGFLPGLSLTDALADMDFGAWSATAHALADAITALHEEGLCHGDLHAGNLWCDGSRVVLLDLQRTHRLRGERERLADLARLEFSLGRRGLDRESLLVLRRACGVGDEIDDALIHFERDYLRGRSRRVLRPGRRWTRVVHPGPPAMRGVCEASLPANMLAKALGADPEFESETQTRDVDCLASTRRGGRVRVEEVSVDGRTFIRKTVSAGGWSRALADRLRGSAAARAFRRGQALQLVSTRAAGAVAYVDRRRFGVPVESVLLLDKVGELDLDRLEPTTPEEGRRVAQALGAWLAEGHAKGIGHRDLKGGNIRISISPEGLRFWLIDLEDLEPVARVPEAARIEALSQLNASLADESFDRAARLAALEAYAERLPFARPIEAVAQQIARRSLERRHRYRGEDCGCVASRTRP